MSYICLYASQQGLAAAGDSRLTMAPIPLHWDRARKVHSAPERRRVWACCGLTVFGGVNYAGVASRILRSGRGTLEEQLRQICRRVNPPLRVQRKLYHQDTTFSLLLGQFTTAGTKLIALDLNGKKETIRRWNGPGMLEAGWKRALRPPMPTPEQFQLETAQELAERARKRVVWVIAEDHRLARTRKRHIQTVGGPTAWVMLERQEGTQDAENTQRIYRL